MSFFDEGDEPRQPRPRRPMGGSLAAPDQQTVRVRQAVAAGVGLLVIILLVVGVRGCLNSQKKRALRDYNRDVASLVQESDQQVGKPLFEQLSGAAGGAAGDPINLETQVNQLRVVSEDLVKRARKQNVPDEMRPAQSNLITVLELRRDALTKIAAQLPNTQATGGGQQAIAKITGQMLAFLSSDVLYSQRVIPYIQQALDDAGITGQTIPTSQFLPNLSWLDEQEVATRLGATAQGGAATPKGGPAAPGSHGHGLTDVTVGDTALDAEGVTRIPAASNVTLSVSFENQAENDETNVIVKVTITGSGSPITAQGTAPTSAAGETTKVDVPLRQAPPIGAPVKIDVSVEPVAGEEDASNNKRTYSAIFTR